MATKLDDLGLYDIYDVCHVSWWQSKNFFMIVSAVAAVLLGVLLLIIIKKWRHKKVAISFWQHAIEELEDLRLAYVNDTLDRRECYFAMTRILKTYLALRYCLQTEDKTDVQLVAYLEQSCLPTQLINDIAPIFIGGLTIKFANEQVARDLIERNLEQSIHFIKKTVHAEDHQ
jgi:LPS O-antigen subunit length determinant protein (WzzB/FepE family)